LIAYYLALYAKMQKETIHYREAWPFGLWPKLQTGLFGPGYLLDKTCPFDAILYEYAVIPARTKYMETEKTGAGALVARRIEELLQHSSLQPETVLNIMRAARANPDYDVAGEIERL
jgi:hypothetical protein